MIAKTCVVAALAAIFAAVSSGGAQAELVISTAATSNVSCSGGVCTATAADAVLNVRDLMKDLTHGDTTVASGSTAQDIEFDAAVHWTSAHRLTLDSYRSITFTQPVTSEGTGGVTITTNDGGTGGDFIFSGKGRVVFWDLASSLIINTTSYMLVGNIATLASDIAATPSGAYALANNYNASVDGTYSNSPITTDFTGAFEGLGNGISHLTMHGAGLFSLLAPGSTARDLSLVGEVIDITGGSRVGGLVATNDGTIAGVSIIGGSIIDRKNGQPAIGGLVGTVADGSITRSFSSARVACPQFCWGGGLVGQSLTTISQSSATGSVTGGNNSEVGGLVGRNEGSIVQSFATGAVSTGDTVKNDANFSMAGGLVGSNEISISQCYATGSASAGSGVRHPANHTWAGGLAGNSPGWIWQSYATGSASVGDQGYVGGIAGAGPLGLNVETTGIAQSYSTGAVSVTTGTSLIGGFLGDDTGTRSGPSAATYWNLDTSGVSDPSKGAGNIANDPGITGLTTTQLQSGLPAGFDPTYWGQSPGINNGLPYLLALPPQ
jgi:hypothetical protein